MLFSNTSMLFVQTTSPDPHPPAHQNFAEFSPRSLHKLGAAQIQIKDLMQPEFANKSNH